MEPTPREPPPTLVDAILGLMIMAGAGLILAAAPTAVLLPFKAHGPNWDWQWSFILGGVFGLTFAAVGGALVFVSDSIAKYRWRMQGKIQDSAKR